MIPLTVAMAAVLVLAMFVVWSALKAGSENDDEAGR